MPQYSSATVVGTVTSLAWNGSVGGVAALDVAGTLNFNGNSVNVNGQGFRGEEVSGIRVIPVAHLQPRITVLRPPLL